MIRLTLLSHAGTRAERDGCFPDADAPPFDVTVDRQALGRIDRCWTAAEARARGTAAAVGIEAAVLPDLRDLDLGTWRGRRLDEIAAADPGGAAAWLADPGAVPHGGEALKALIDRVGAWLDRLDTPGAAVAVTHPAVIRAALLYVLDAPASAFWRIDVVPLTIADLRRNGSRWTLRSLAPLQQAGHLPGEEGSEGGGAAGIEGGKTR